MLNSRRASSISSSASVSVSRNPAITSTIGSMSSIGIDRSTTSTLSFRNLGAVPTTLSVTERKKEKDRPAWKRLTRKISKTFSGTAKKDKGAMLVLTVPPTVNEDERSVSQKGKALTVKTATPVIALAHVSLSEMDTSTRVQHAAEYNNSNAESSVIDGVITENADEPAEEMDYSSGDTQPQLGAESLPSKPSPSLLDELINSIPADLPLIRYIAECVLIDQVPPPMLPPPVVSLDANGREEQRRTKDVESQLFFRCLELGKWTLAQTLAEKMQRRVAFQYHHREQESDSHSSSEASEVHSERIHLSSSAITEEEALDAHDVILSFLDTCSS